MTPAQAAQSKNRSHGQYAVKQFGDPGTNLPLGIDDRIKVSERLENALCTLDQWPDQNHPLIKQSRAALTIEEPNTREGFKTWCQRNSGKDIDTTQVKVEDGQLRHFWPAGVRSMAAGPTFMSWNDGDPATGSRRDFSGITALHSTDTRMIGYDEKMHTLISYEVVNWS